MGEPDKLFSKAIRLRDEGRLADAQVILEDLVPVSPHSVALFAVLGGVYYDREMLVQAVHAFRRAILIAPRCEVASLGLFHSLWKMDAQDEAFSEMKRFLGIAESENYSTLLREWHSSLFPDDAEDEGAKPE